MSIVSSATILHSALKTLGLVMALVSMAACSAPQGGASAIPANFEPTLGQPKTMQQDMEEKHTVPPCSSKGGTWEAPSFGRRLRGVVGYGSNTCTPGYHIGIWSYFESPQGWPTPSGYTASFVVCYYIGAFSFQGSGIRGSVVGSYLQDSKTYLLSIYSYSGSQYSLISQQSLGTPANGKLTFISPFQDGFLSGANGEFCFVFAVPNK